MAENTGSPDPAAAVSAEQTSTAQVDTQAPESFIDTEYTLQGDWKTLIPEEFRGRKVFDTVHTMKDVLSQLGNKDVLISRQGKDLAGAVPTETSTQAEKDLFYDAIGRPKTPADYKVAIPEGMGDYYDQELIAEARESLHAAGLTQKQVDAVMALDARRLEKGIKELGEKQESDMRAAEDALRAQWGTAYDQRLELANRMIAENVADDTAREKIVAAIGNNPHVADFLANIAKKFMEHGVVTQTTQSTAMTPGEAKGRMDEMIADQLREPDMRNTNPAKYERINREILKLAEAAVAGQK